MASEAKLTAIRSNYVSNDNFCKVAQAIYIDQCVPKQESVDTSKLIANVLEAVVGKHKKYNI